MTRSIPGAGAELREPPDPVASAWADKYTTLVREAIVRGDRRGSRDGATLDLGPTTIQVWPPPFTMVDWRKGSAEFALVEQLCYLAGSNPDPLTKISPRFERYKEGGKRRPWWGAYGPRIHRAMKRAATELALRPDSRRVWVPIYNAMDLHAAAEDDPPNDIPCTLGIGFWRERDMLHAHAQMRSCDLWFGLYYDCPAYAMLQRALAAAISPAMRTGSLWITMTSCHIYEKHVERALEGVRALTGQAPFGTTVSLPIPRQPNNQPNALRMTRIQEWATALLTWFDSQPDPKAVTWDAILAHADAIEEDWAG